MRQNSQKPKTKIEVKPESVVVIRQPLVRDFSTAGGHGPGNEIFEGDSKTPTKKWQGYPPENLNVIGKNLPPMPEVSIPRFLGKAEYATRVMPANTLFAKMLSSPHPRARIRDIDTSKAEKMPGVHYILTYKNSPKTLPPYPQIDTRTNATVAGIYQDLNMFGDIVAFVAAETEDLAEDAIEAIQVDYEVLPFATTLQQVMAPNAPDLRQGKGNLFKAAMDDPRYVSDATSRTERGDLAKGFAESDVVKEFTYYFSGATVIPMQPHGSTARWDGEKLTFWGMAQGIHPYRAMLARGLGIDPNQIRYIDKYNGCTFGAANEGSKLDVFTAYLAKMTGRPVKLMLPKDQELAHIRVKPENVQKFKVGVKKDGRIIAMDYESYEIVGNNDIIGGAIGGGGGLQGVYVNATPNLKSSVWSYKANSMRTGAVRKPGQQEYKWGWEILIDELAEAVEMDPIQFRLMNMPKPGSRPAGRGAPTTDSFASVEVLEEGAKVFGWEKRNPTPGGSPGRFKRGMGVAASQHGAGISGYHDGEPGFERMLGERQAQAARRADNPFGQQQTDVFGAEVEVNADGFVTVKNALPDSGNNHDTALCAIVAEMLGFTTRDRMRVVWGDTDTTPPSDRWRSALTITLQGAAVYSAADKLRKDLLQRGAQVLKVDVAKLQIKDGVISSTDDARKRTTFAALARAVQGRIIRQAGRSLPAGGGRSYSGVGACFVEVEVDTWTGDWRFLRTVYSHDFGLVVNPVTAEADMHGSLVQALQVTTDPLPYDREFPGTRHYSVGYLSYRLPTIMEMPEQHQVFVDSLEPRWFYGIKGGSETTIGAVPGAIANAIYNACGVRIREHPLTKEKIMAGLATKRRSS